MVDNLKGAILGLAVADALGVPVEFESREALKNDPVLDIRAYGTYNQPKGTWSDDTTMTICLLESLSRGLDYKDIMDNFIKWYLHDDFTAHDELFDIGITTSKALDYYIKGVDPIFCGGDHERDNGNGSLMRIIPLLFYFYKAYGTFDYSQKMFDIIHNISNLTHRHPRSHIACGIYISISHEIFQESSLEEAITKGISNSFTYYSNIEIYSAELHHYNRLKDEKFKEVLEDDISSSGYVVSTLEASIWVLLNTTSYKEAALKAVNLGEDTDTIGAITGGLAGLYYGYSDIPEKWLEVLVKRDYLESVCEN